MLSSEKYIRTSLEYNLFWVRVMKEHAIFIESSMPGSQKQLAYQADQFKQQFDRLLAETIRLANGVVSKEALQSGQYYTWFTESTEQAVQHFTGIEINTNLTQAEYNIQAYSQGTTFDAQKEQEVSTLNQYILSQTNALARFKSELLNSQSSCRIFSFLYTGDMDHILREAVKYIEILNALQNRDDNFNTNYKEFWNRNMSDHAKSMRGLFDPTEAKYFSEADRFAKMFDALLQTQTASAYGTQSGDDLTDTKAISDFKANTTQGLLECKVKSIMSPLYADHNLREAYHYIYLMQS
jgi:RNA processing factor Prp31